MTGGSKEICTPSACPVASSQSCSWVGCGTWPPEYPETTDSTPCRSLKTASRHQKPPPASVATSSLIEPYDLLSLCARRCRILTSVTQFTLIRKQPAGG